MALEDEGNIHRAAQVLNMTQPAASKLLKELEDALGVSLFERLPRGMRATWYGETMIRHARMALASLTQAHDEIEALKAGRFGQVSVGAITSPGLNLLPAAVAQVKLQHPSLRVQLADRDQRRADGAAGAGQARHRGGPAVRAPRQDRRCATRPSSRSRSAPSPAPATRCWRATRLSLRDVAGAGWIVPPAGSVLRHRFELMFQEDGLEPPTNLIETTALLFVTKMLQQSDMLGVIATDVARYYAQHGMVSLLPIALPCKMDAFGLITRTDRLLSPAAKVMLRALKSAALSAYGTELDLTGLE